MNRRTIRLIILFAVITVIGVFSFQIFWVQRAFNSQEKQFNDRVHVALTEVVSKVQQINMDSSDLYEPVKQVTGNYFVASTNDTLHPQILKTLLKKEFSNRNLDSDFEFVVYDCFTDSIVFGDYVDLEAEEKSLVYRTSNNDRWSLASHYFGVYFPKKTSYLVNEMGIWVVSTIFLLLVVVFFSYTIWVILKQKRLSEIRTDFINNMTHELKTPISTIALSTEVLSNPNITEDPERLNNYANIIKEETERLESQVDKVLEMATLDKSKAEFKVERVDLHKIIKKTVKGFEVIMDSNGGKLSTDLKAEKTDVYVDSTHLSNILFNLIDNAIKYSKGSPDVQISSVNHKGGVYLRVKDHGIGMSKEEQKHIFEKFYRVPTGDRHDVKGYGIGLNYVKSMLNEFNGKILLKSEPNMGSTFKIYLPQKQ